MAVMEDWPTGIVEQVHPKVRRVLAANPSPFTYTGTETYIVGTGEVAVIDPGPDLPDHVAAILRATEGERIAAILCTHTHRDHSPASRPLAATGGAATVGMVTGTGWPAATRLRWRCSASTFAAYPPSSAVLALPT